MKGPIFSLQHLFFYALLCLSTCISRAQVLSPGLVGGGAENDLWLSTPGYETSHGYDGFEITVDDSNHLSIPTTTIGRALALFVSHAGEVIDHNYISTTQRVADNWSYAVGVSYAALPDLRVGESVYLAFWRDAVFDYPYQIYGATIPLSSIGPGDQIGWAEISRTASGLELTASALDTSATGLAVGSYTVIPEPATYAVAMACVIFGNVLFRRRSLSGEFFLAKIRAPMRILRV